MGSSVKTGVNWLLDGNTIDIFGARGCKLGRNSWGVNALGGELMVEVNRDTVSDKIAECIQDDRRAGNEDKIAYVGVSSRQAVILYLEGVLTLEALQKAEETTDTITVRAVLDGQERTLRIFQETSYRFATFDANDQIV